MKRTILLMLVFSLSLSAISYAQDGKSKEQKKLSRAEKKALKQAQMKAEKDSILQIIESKQWVMESYQLQFRGRYNYNVSPSNNFIVVKGDRFLWQYAFNGATGANGIGGATLDGRFTKFEVNPGDKVKSAIRIQMKTLASGTGPVSITMSVNSDGDAKIFIQPSFRNEYMIFIGKLVPLDATNNYKGLWANIYKGSLF